MAKRSSKKPRDINALASAIVAEATGGEPPKPTPPDKQTAQARKKAGKKGGQKGGPARAKSLTPERRKEIAKRAAEARWKGKPSE
jgi:hypothetical protein